MTPDQKEKAIEYFDFYPEEHVLHMTEDGQVFLHSNHNDAVNHQRSLNPANTITTISRKDLGAYAPAFDYDSLTDEEKAVYDKTLADLQAEEEKTKAAEDAKAEAKRIADEEALKAEEQRIADEQAAQKEADRIADENATKAEADRVAALKTTEGDTSKSEEPVKGKAGKKDKK